MKHSFYKVRIKMAEVEDLSILYAETSWRSFAALEGHLSTIYKFLFNLPEFEVGWRFLFLPLKHFRSSRIQELRGIHHDKLIFQSWYQWFSLFPSKPCSDLFGPGRTRFVWKHALPSVYGISRIQEEKFSFDKKYKNQDKIAKFRSQVHQKKPVVFSYLLIL